jgi:hypothetical protein
MNKPSLKVKREGLHMDSKKRIRLSPAEWKEISAGLELSPDDLSMITSGLELLTKSQLELAKFASTQHRDDNLADCLEEWGNKSQELLTRIIEHHSACISKILKKQKRGN